jgi:hypothetical protein
MVSGKIHLYLSLLEFCFLKAKAVCIDLLEELHKVLSHYGSEAVDIP